MPMVYGTINENGGIEVNSGQITSAERSDKGRYSVSFQSGTFKTTPVVVATVMTTDSKCGESTNRTISVADATPSDACFGIRQANAGNESSDRPFSFVAFG
jgi:hypothetical protein